MSIKDILHEMNLAGKALQNLDNQDDRKAVRKARRQWEKQAKELRAKLEDAQAQAAKRGGRKW